MQVYVVCFFVWFYCVVTILLQKMLIFPLNVNSAARDGFCG